MTSISSQRLKLLILFGLCMVLVLAIILPWFDSVNSDLPRGDTPSLKIEPIYLGNGHETAQGKIPTTGPVADYINRVRNEHSVLLNEAIKLLGDLQDPAIVEPLLWCLNDKNAMIRTSAAYALGQTKDPRAIKPLLELLQRRKKKWDYASIYAAEALGNFNDPRIIPPLMAALNDPRYELRGYAASSLGKMKVKEAEQFILQKLEDPQWFVRQRAAIGLHEMQAENRAEAYIRAIQKETHENTLDNLIRYLGKTGEPSAVPPLLETLRTSPYPNIRVTVTIALGDIKDSAAIAPLEQALLQETDDHVKRWLEIALRELKEAQENGTLRYQDGQPTTIPPMPVSD